jgi:hypothetical protein
MVGTRSYQDVVSLQGGSFVAQGTKTAPAPTGPLVLDAASIDLLSAAMSGTR